MKKKSKKYGQLDYYQLPYGVVEEYHSTNNTPSLIARFADDEEAKHFITILESAKHEHLKYSMITFKV